MHFRALASFLKAFLLLHLYILLHCVLSVQVSVMWLQGQGGTFLTFLSFLTFYSTATATFTSYHNLASLEVQTQ